MPRKNLLTRDDMYGMPLTNLEQAALNEFCKTGGYAASIAKTLNTTKISVQSTLSHVAYKRGAKSRIHLLQMCWEAKYKQLEREHKRVLAAYNAVKLPPKKNTTDYQIM